MLFENYVKIEYIVYALFSGVYYCLRSILIKKNDFKLILNFVEFKT